MDTLNEKGELVKDAHEKANIFNKYFINIGKKMSTKFDKNIESNSHSSNTIFTSKEVSTSIFLRPVTENEIISIINKLKNRSLAGPDKIPSGLIKAVHSNLIKPLKYIINLVIKSETLSDLILFWIHPLYSILGCIDLPAISFTSLVLVIGGLSLLLLVTTPSAS